jgi:arylsulfatase A-like enzyme
MNPVFIPLLPAMFLALPKALPAAEVGAKPAPARPNILLILVDDMGFSDLGCYGSEIETPNLDRLAKGGLRFTQFYNTAKCHSSRASLLTGLWCEQAGGSSLARAITIPEVLGPAGYFTAMTGKWHLDKEPTDFGFQRYWGHLSGAGNYYKGNDSFRLNGQPWEVPQEGFYTTVANVDFALRFLDEAREAKKPWFLYVAFNAPHAPLQPLEADYKKYLGRYDVGWDVMRTARVAKQEELGLFTPGVRPAPRPDHIPAWDSLSPEMKSWESRRMAAYAGLVDRVDQELGRLFADLEKTGELDNTIVLFFSDNGACPYDRRSVGRDREPYDPDTTWSDSTGWAWARNTPFRFYKQNQFEGGIATPAIIYWPAGLKTEPGSLSAFPSHLVDVLPTLVEVCGVEVPARWPGREPSPPSGVSLRSVLAGAAIKDRPPMHFMFSTDRALRDGDWKLVSYKGEPWELYHIADDRTELNDLAAEYPEIVERMAKEWTDMATDVLRVPARHRRPVSETATDPRRNAQWTDYSAVEGSTARHEAARREKRLERKGGKESPQDVEQP